ncbi:hypothetical protein [Anabaena sp. UHCC 0451]|uniref:hypothetical protein n=1 Tax=Anabaena sp. UHCC 0451 TaxID=2055235 RepID=UPI002B1EC036|nr:hypothetical protein [Anabaena sp. UHCC 0451]MEA5575279.1 hypothetical protein [Anabaena sp. UHCC 0451]
MGKKGKTTCEPDFFSIKVDEKTQLTPKLHGAVFQTLGKSNFPGCASVVHFYSFLLDGW